MPEPDLVASDTKTVTLLAMEAAGQIDLDARLRVAPAPRADRTFPVGVRVGGRCREG